MKNRYPAACSVCQAMVEAGCGRLTRSGTRWLVTHDGFCPASDLSSGHARDLARRTARVLQDGSSCRAQVREAIVAAGQMVATGWLAQEKCEALILAAPASRKLDRVEIAVLLEKYCAPVAT
jgi:hypothetical protein